MTTRAPVNRAALEQAVHRRVNETRSSNELSTLEFDTRLREIARAHSADMASTGYFGHESPDGKTMADRYERYDYDCRVPLGDNRYLTGGENLFKTSAAVGGVDGLASEVVSGWMNSAGHRKNVLRPEFRREGIGVAISSEGAVYVTQNFC